MRIGSVSVLSPLSMAAAVAGLALGCGLIDVTPSGGASSSTAGAADASADAQVLEAGVTGANCGIESGSGQQLCQATSLCPTLVVDTTAMPHCGFRIKAGATELVCACGEMICSMGAYTTCTQAAGLLASQTEQQVCAQLSEDRCTAGSPAPAPAGSSGTSGTSGTSGGTGTCDHQCLSECGGGGGCASICGC